MNAAEAITLCRLVKGACPQQAIDEFTPDAWLMILEPYRFEDCRQAVVEIVRRQPFIAPAEIIQQVKRIRYKRIEEFGTYDPPAAIEGVYEYQQWMRDMQTRIADGSLTREAYDAQQGIRGRREMPALDGVFRRVDNDVQDGAA